ncbi:hypothetical protein IB276_17995 [Ensifer sp. ENS04]|uniref:hypothetical protein n=1 Tax=Ensifer sp. ENS04 TaxID=2769281 RepID=UPI00178625BC|nr:hypothetical protein [Ensifer sp. ENS04]MBD9541348.1 hypothetical protein [Ensifer sp. ENS04]
MKSPWKFLRNLASRGTATEPASAPDIEIRTPEEVPAAAVEAPIATIDEAAAQTAVVANEPANDRPLDAPSIVEETVSGDAPSTGRADQAQARVQESPSEDTPIKRPTRPKRSIARNVAPAARVEYGTANSQVPAPPLTFSEEVLALDEDIRQLRRQLTEKLSLQNAQLKKMLERF